MEEDGIKTLKHNKRILFQRMAPYPQRKVITFNRYTDDFAFDINYGDLSFLSQDDIRLERLFFIFLVQMFLSKIVLMVFNTSSSPAIEDMLSTVLRILCFNIFDIGGVLQCIRLPQPDHSQTVRSRQQLSETHGRRVQRHQSSFQHG